MKFYSTNNKKLRASLRKAILKGLAEDGGLFMPEKIPQLSAGFFISSADLSFQEISLEALRPYFEDDIPINILQEIIKGAFNFDAPLVRLDDKIYVLELFHGPTLAFKDFSARFMARVMSYLIRNSDDELFVLVATSGDTGSAVANGFLGVEGIKVVILYPSGKVSEIQEKQLTTMGNNITALEIKGAYDDCQKLVKAAFVDKELSYQMQLTSANSINIARLLPQICYYMYAYAQLKDKEVVFSVPSGNFGNLTAGLIAKKMGLPVRMFVAATNINDSVPRYLESGRFEPHPSYSTISNAMDVGNPSNFSRMLELYNNDIDAMRKDVHGVRFTDKQTRGIIKQVHQQYNYILDPHGAVGYLGLKNLEAKLPNNRNGIFLETAHPAKFLDVVQPLVKEKIQIPSRLQKCLDKKKQSIVLSNKFEELKLFLLS
ncbi:threonine synthase [Patescibacteria group bacterium AH-259-L07]|nr:threonine synthase [Patescibacteria group bacterium AH-259-L07]